MVETTVPELLERLKELSSEDLHAALSKISHDLLRQVPAAHELFEAEQAHRKELQDVVDCIKQQRAELIARDRQNAQELQSQRRRFREVSGRRWW